MSARITIIGGGSYQWAPKLLVDLANTPSLHDAHVVFEDINPEPLPRMIQLVEHIARVRRIGLSASSTTDQRASLEGAEYVVVCISTGGFESMRADLEIPARYGIRQSVGDTVGPGGILRAQRNVPVMLGIARDMEDICPDAWLLNVTNPMTTLCRAITKETSIKTIGLCHEVTIQQFFLSLLLDASFFDVDPVVAGVNHLPIITSLPIGSDDGLAMLRELVERQPWPAEPLAMDLPDGLGFDRPAHGGEWTKADLMHVNRMKLEMLRRFGVLPAAGDRHLVEFFPGFLTEESQWGARWGVKLSGIDEREYWQGKYIEELDEMFASDEVSEWPSGEMVAHIIDSFITGMPRNFPLNIPNDGQVPELPNGAVVESICRVDADGVRGRDQARVGGVMGEYLRRVSASQELVVEAAVAGDRGKVLEAMLADPLAGRIDFDLIERMMNDMLEATKPWLPQFA